MDRAELPRRTTCRGSSKPPASRRAWQSRYDRNCNTSQDAPPASMTNRVLVLDSWTRPYVHACKNYIKKKARHDKSCDRCSEVSCITLTASPENGQIAGLGQSRIFGVNQASKTQTKQEAQQESQQDKRTKDSRSTAPFLSAALLV